MMKKLFFLLPLFLLVGMAVASAQCCKGASAGASCSSKVTKAAAADPSIEKRQAEDGTVSYVRKEADQQGNVRFVSVQFDEATNTFVNVAPKTMTAEDKAGAVKKGAACAEGAGTGKACCKSGSASTEKKACCAKGGSNGKACAGEAAQ